jgi:O-antigen/teichoic acid export membrane protein
VIFLLFFAGEYRLFFAIHAVLLIGALLDVNWFFLGIEQVAITVMRSSAVKLLAAASVFIFVRTPDDLWKYLLIMGLGTLLGQAMVWVFISRFVTVMKPSLSGMKSHIKPLLIMFIPVIALSVYNILDKIILGAIAGQTELGFYENSQKLILVPAGFITAFNAVMLPRMSNLGAKENTSEKSRLMLISMKYVMLLALAMAFGIAAIADGFAPLFFGWEFAECGVLIKTLCLIIPFLAFQNVLTAQFLIPGRRDKIYTASAAAAALINVFANLILIPRFGALGAVISTVFAECLRCIIVAAAAKNHLPVGVYIKNSLFFLAAGAVMFVLVSLIGAELGTSVVTVLIQISAGIAFYLGVCAVYFYVTKDAFFRENLKRFMKR